MTETDRERHRHRDTDRQRHKERHKDRDRETESGVWEPGVGGGWVDVSLLLLPFYLKPFNVNDIRVILQLSK